MSRQRCPCRRCSHSSSYKFHSFISKGAQQDIQVHINKEDTTITSTYTNKFQKMADRREETTQ